MELPERVVVITGASTGIGRATAFAVGRAGARVAICARTVVRLERTLRALADAGVTAIGRPCDVGDVAQVEAFAKHVMSELGPADALINNAGVGRFRPFEELTLEDWDETLDTNVRSLFLVTRAFLPSMTGAGRGTIVNVASLAGRSGFVGGTAYAASKHAVLGFSRSLMLELRSHGIRVITVCPGSVDTDLFNGQAMIQPERDRILTPEDVAATILHTLTLPERAMVSEIDIRPTHPR